MKLEEYITFAMKLYGKAQNEENIVECIRILVVMKEVIDDSIKKLAEVERLNNGNS